jgi:SAM-dependent methyltransferase
MTVKSPVTKVSKDHWRQAQAVELKTWQHHNAWYRRTLGPLARRFGLQVTRTGDDWNHWWYTQFHGYRILPDRLQNAIELGCGPYTNMRWIWRNRHIDHVICSDPLAVYYTKFKGQWLSSQYARRKILIDDHPIEECPFRDDYFDLVVMINVLDHVRDAFLCLDTAMAITRPSGYLIVGQDLTNEEDAAKTAVDISHPIRLHHEDLDRAVADKFTAHFYRILDRMEGRNPQAHYGTYLFIGRKNEAD